MLGKCSTTEYTPDLCLRLSLSQGLTKLPNLDLNSLCRLALHLPDSDSKVNGAAGLDSQDWPNLTVTPSSPLLCG